MNAPKQQLCERCSGYDTGHFCDSCLKGIQNEDICRACMSDVDTGVCDCNRYDEPDNCVYDVDGDVVKFIQFDSVRPEG